MQMKFLKKSHSTNLDALVKSLSFELRRKIYTIYAIYNHSDTDYIV